MPLDDEEAHRRATADAGRLLYEQLAAFNNNVAVLVQTIETQARINHALNQTLVHLCHLIAADLEADGIELPAIPTGGYTIQDLVQDVTKVLQRHRRRR